MVQSKMGVSPIGSLLTFQIARHFPRNTHGFMGERVFDNSRHLEVFFMSFPLHGIPGVPGPLRMAKKTPLEAWHVDSRDINTHYIGIYRAYIGISHRGTLVGVHLTIPWLKGLFWIPTQLNSPSQCWEEFRISNFQEVVNHFHFGGYHNLHFNLANQKLQAQLNLPSPLQWYIQKNIRGPFYINSIFNHDTHKNLKESPTSRVVDLALNQSQTLETNILDP